MMLPPSLLFSDDYDPSTDGVVQLMTRARNLLTRSLDARLAELDITHAQAGILWMLSTGRFGTATDLARDLVVDAASTTRMIDRLEKRRLIVRMPRGDDRRVIHLRLTVAGVNLAKQLPAIYSSVMNRSFAGFSVEEFSQLRGLLGKLLTNSTSIDVRSYR